MKSKKKQQNKSQTEKIKNMISFNNKKNPFKDSKESEKFFKNIIEEEMNLSNNYNSENLNRLLNLYFKGLNLYQNTPNLDKVNAFIEKSQLLLQSSQAKKILNQNKMKTPDVNEIKTDSTLIDENEESDYSNKNKIENQQKEKNNNEEEEEEDEIYNIEGKLQYNFKKYKTIKHNEIQNRNKLHYLSNSIKTGMREKDNQKLKINEINEEFNNMKQQQLKTSIFLEDEIKKQSNNFKQKLIRKRTMMVNKPKNNKLKIDTIPEEVNEKNNLNINNNKNRNKIGKKNRNRTPKNKNSSNIIFNKVVCQQKLKRNSFSFFVKNINIKNKNKENIYNIDNIEKQNNNYIENKDNKNEKLKEIINKYIEEYNNDICKYYFYSRINKISDLSKQNFLSNLNIYEGYQINIKDLLRKQISCNDKEKENILEDDINSLKEEHDHEIQKNNDLYDKFIDEEISKFKLFGYSHSSPKELDILKNKIKCIIYKEINNILNK